MTVTADRKILGKELNMIGVVGKNGKSIIGQIIHHCYLALGVDNKLGTAEEFLNKILPESYEKKIKTVIIEVSSCAIKEKKVSYIDFDSLIFTNSSKNAELDEKWTMRRPFIALPLDKTAIINIDDEHGADFCDVTVARILTYGLYNSAGLNALNIKLSIDKTEFDLYYTEKFVCKVEMPYFGLYNVYNALAAIAHFVSEGYNPVKIAQLFPKLPKIEGCFDTFSTDTGVEIVIDYARTSEAIGAVLKSLASVRGGNVITVVGVHGATTAIERAAIGKNAMVNSKQVIFTTNNPQTEEPQSVIYDIIKGNIRQNYRICLNREKAIEVALKMAKPKDVVVLLGKGYKDSKIIGEKMNVFCDKTTALYLAQKLEI